LDKDDTVQEFGNLSNTKAQNSYKIASTKQKYKH